MATVCRPRPRAFVYLPLLLHVAPTLLIGFGFIIPRSCIAGVNVLTVGFVVTIAGFILSYIAGVRIARRQGVRAHA